MIPPLFGKQEEGIWWVQKHFPQYGIPIWSLWQNIRFLSHICTFFVTFFSATIDGRNLIFGHKLHIGTNRVSIWSLWPNIRSLSLIVAEKNVTKNVHICSMCIKINKIGKQEAGIWWVQKRFSRYGVPIWSLWPNIRFLPSIVAEKNETKNQNICSMWINFSQ
jgi:ribosomal protein L28